eukprot:15455061-Alexandrium_andersonii.AAC.1
MAARGSTTPLVEEEEDDEEEEEEEEKPATADLLGSNYDPHDAKAEEPAKKAGGRGAGNAGKSAGGAKRGVNNKGSKVCRACKK